MPPSPGALPEPSLNPLGTLPDPLGTTFRLQVSAWTPAEQRPGAAAASPSSAAEDRKLRVRSSASGLVLPRTGVPAGPAAGAAGAEGWLSGGPHVGQRLLRRLEGHGDIGAVVRLYLPPGEARAAEMGRDGGGGGWKTERVVSRQAEDEPALWRIEHDDGEISRDWPRSDEAAARTERLWAACFQLRAVPHQVTARTWTSTSCSSQSLGAKGGCGRRRT